MKKFSVLFLCCCMFAAAFGQTSSDWRLWATSGVKLRVHKKLSFGASYFTTYNFSQKKIKYDQIRLSTTYSPKKRWYLTTAYVRAQSKTSKNITHRIAGELSYPSTIPFDFLTHYIAVEKFFPSTKKYAWRISYALRLKRTLLSKPFPISSYTSGRLFYFYGGIPVQHYDENGEQTYLSVGNGLHRFRWTTGLDIRPSKHFQLKLFWMIQREFNLGITRTEINVINPNNQRVKNRFSNYQVFGLSGKIRIDSRKKN